MGDWTRDTPWLQGHILHKADAAHLGLYSPNFPDATVVLVISHDCDLAQMPAQEPDVEVLLGHTVKAAEGHNTFGKNARLLELEFSGDESFWAQFNIQNRKNIQKTVLQNFVPNANTRLAPLNLKTLQRWLASRYSRPAFPDEFDDRIKNQSKIAEKLKKLAKTRGANIPLFLFDLREKKDDVYPLGIQIVYMNSPDPAKALEDAQFICNEIRKLFESKLYNETENTWRLIELLFCDSISDEDLSYEQYGKLQRWNLDYVSLDSEKPQDGPVD